jgi:8-amino-7-oxononanoate synthase
MNYMIFGEGMEEDFLYKKLHERTQQNALRQLRLSEGKIDFCSNDYLGIVANNLLSGCRNNDAKATYRYGSTGSRLLAGNYPLIEEAEKLIAAFHGSETGLIFNSGYDANLGLLSSIPQKGDTIVYDFLCHASIRDGIRLSFAESFSYKHNDVVDLQRRLEHASGSVFVVTESVFSMDGDTAPLKQITELCNHYGARLIVDEAHATGIIGNRGEGLVQHLNIQDQCFARMHTFGKALGCHGAIVLGSDLLRKYLINFCRPFIYSTALPEASIYVITSAYEIFPGLQHERNHLESLIEDFQAASFPYKKLSSRTPIQGIIVPGNDEVKAMAVSLQQNNFDVRPILYPTVPKGSERLRIVLHAFNTQAELQQLIEILAS